ncbi:MAG: hypothetical protein JWN37_414 [Candidatus Nomurabacteria bacterium]|nr:hypothetical protein [Candidatus Nomurabacteria bacterium]
MNLCGGFMTKPILTIVPQLEVRRGGGEPPPLLDKQLRVDETPPAAADQAEAEPDFQGKATSSPDDVQSLGDVSEASDAESAQVSPGELWRKDREEAWRLYQESKARISLSDPIKSGIPAESVIIYWTDSEPRTKMTGEDVINESLERVEGDRFVEISTTGESKKGVCFIFTYSHRFPFFRFFAPEVCEIKK